MRIHPPLGHQALKRSIQLRGQLDGNGQAGFGGEAYQVVEGQLVHLAARDLGNAWLDHAKALAACALVTPSRVIYLRSASASSQRSSMTVASCGGKSKIKKHVSTAWCDSRGCFLQNFSPMPHRSCPTPRGVRLRPDSSSQVRSDTMSGTRASMRRGKRCLNFQETTPVRARGFILH